LFKQDRNGRELHYEYDQLNRLRYERWFDVSNPVNELEFTYDLGGRLVTAGDDDHTYTYTYDELDRLRFHEASIEDGPTTTLDIVYTKRGMRDSATMTAFDAAGVEVSDYVNSYEFDNLNRLREINQATGDTGSTISKLVNFEYSLDGQLESISRRELPSGATLASSYLYDEGGRLQTLSHGSMETYTLGYDRANRLTSMAFANSTAESVNQFDYDDRSQLEGVDRANPLFNESYQYDENGNRLGTGATQYNRANSIGDATLYYDNEGNLERREDSDGFIIYHWDHRNRLTMVESFTGQFGGTNTLIEQVNYQCDTLNQLIGRSFTDVAAQTPTAETYFVYDQGQIVSQVDGSNLAPSHYYLWSPSVDQLISDDDLANGQINWAMSDQQGTIRDWVMSTGALTEHLNYDQFGNIVATSGPGDISERDLFFAYTGRLTDQATNLQNNLNRWYDSKLGRWISEDPIGFAAGDANLYRYVGNSPTNATDPDGLEQRRSVNDFYILDVIGQRVSGPNGGKPGPWGDFRYTINWLISPKAVKAPKGSGLSDDSWIVQHVQVTFDVKDNNGNPVKHPADDGKWDYWEAWFVGPGRRSPGGGGGKARDDFFSIFGGPKDTHGKIVFRASAQFYPNTTLPASFSSPNTNTHAGGLPASTAANPMAGLRPRSFPPTYHGVVVEWDCTGKTTVTPITTSQSLILPIG
jgi:RHS repeat-associated protein